jgi:hypothetical protein
MKYVVFLFLSWLPFFSAAQQTTYQNGSITLQKINAKAYVITIDFYTNNPNNCVDPYDIGVLEQSPNNKNEYTGYVYSSIAIDKTQMENGTGTAIVLTIFADKIKIQSGYEKNNMQQCFRDGFFKQDAPKKKSKK